MNNLVEYTRHGALQMNHGIIKKVIFDQHQVIKDEVIVYRDIILEKDVKYILVGLRRSGKNTL